MCYSFLWLEKDGIFPDIFKSAIFIQPLTCSNLKETRVPESARVHAHYTHARADKNVLQTYPIKSHLKPLSLSLKSLH